MNDNTRQCPKGIDSLFASLTDPAVAKGRMSRTRRLDVLCASACVLQLCKLCMRGFTSMQSFVWIHAVDSDSGRQREHKS